MFEKILAWMEFDRPSDMSLEKVFVTDVSTSEADVNLSQVTVGNSDESSNPLVYMHMYNSKRTDCK